MERQTRNVIERATQRARRLLEDEFRSQLEARYDIVPKATAPPTANASRHVAAAPRYATIAAAIDRKCASGQSLAEAVVDYFRDAAFTTLNRFVALKMLEARGLVQQCVSRGEESSGYAEFTGMAPGLALLPDGRGYRLYLESLFDELSTEVKVLFDRRDAASVLWPRRAVLEELLQVLNALELEPVWADDETIGWMYQYFNSDDERRQMRKESPQAPRNSRELAVRNQFFTPRYVVQFLTDNTLGRTWLEMHGETTRLAEQCEYLVRLTDEPLESRLRKDPRDLRILDPACGSGHFLLYAFDLLLTIYEEGWAAADAPKSELTGQTLREDYPDLATLRRAAPGLIVEHNLYGVDIDARCAQIAALALWLRAQRAYQALGLAAGSRPRTRRTHVIVAEPMPDSPDLEEAFAAELDKPFLRTLFARMIEEMRLAGELGTLLQVERSLADDIARARDQFLSDERTLLPGFEPKAQQGRLDLSGVTDETVFHDAEDAILAALHRFAESAGGTDTRRRLFAGDASQGVALIDLLRTRFDTVLMNPPFGAASVTAKHRLENEYPRTKNDIYAAFVERGLQLLRPQALLGAITSRTGFFLSTFRKWREEVILKEAPPVVCADLGNGVMDAAMVEAAAYCLQKSPHGSTPTQFFRLLDADNKEVALREALKASDNSASEERFRVHAATFAAVPGSPFAYWISDRVQSLFGTNQPLEGAGREVCRGATTNDDDRFLRLWLEVSPHALAQERWQTRSRRWVILAKGGEHSRYFADQYLVIDWRLDGRSVKAHLEEYRGSRGWGYQWSAQLNGHSHYFRPGLTWSRRSQRGLSMRALPAGSIFGDKGPCVFVQNDAIRQLLHLLAITNSDAFRNLVAAQMAFGSYEVGVMERTPLPDIAPNQASTLASLSSSAWSLKRSLDTRNETSHAFLLPAALQVTQPSLDTRALAWSERSRIVEGRLAATQAEIDRLCFEAYGMEEEDSKPTLAAFTGGATDVLALEDETEDVSGTEDVTDVSVNAGSLTSEVLSWATGVAFGRFDIRLAIGARPIPPEPEPFDPLPLCSPGMLTGDNRLPLSHPPVGYPITFPVDGLLVDDPGHPRDLTAAVRAVFDIVFGARADAFWQDAAALLDSRNHDLRHWLISTFFEYHLRRYSKKPRKAPILWQFAVPSVRYSVWCYAHHMTRDSLFIMQNDIVAPKLTHEERRLSSLVTQAGANPSARDRAEIADQESFVEELRTMLDEVRRVAPLWNPDLDDGIVLVMAPLWRLVPTHRAWQKELRSKWEELVAGKYDWAHLAMHLWPERVVPKCSTDRSLAIAHGLEDVFWVEGPDGKWTRRAVPARTVDDLVAERTSPAVMAALASLLEAPEPTAGGRKRGRRAGVAS